MTLTDQQKAKIREYLAAVNDKVKINEVMFEGRDVSARVSGWLYNDNEIIFIGDCEDVLSRANQHFSKEYPDSGWY